LYHREQVEALKVVAIQTAELRMEEDERTDRYAESRHGNEDLPRFDSTGSPEDCRDDQSDDRAPYGERRSDPRENSFDLPTVDLLYPIRATVDLRRRELDHALLRDLENRHGPIIVGGGRATVTSS
jgi:hypothetical protein